LLTAGVQAAPIAITIAAPGLLQAPVTIPITLGVF
jgi:hypothetical protein